MSTMSELEKELNEKLRELHDEVSKERQKDANPNDLQKQTDRFLVDWSERLFTERINHVDDARLDILKERGNATGPDERMQYAKLLDEFKEAEDAIEDQLKQLKDGMVKGVQAIVKEQEPELVQLRPYEKQKEYPLTDWAKAIDPDELTPERVRAELQAIKELRAKEKTKDSEPDNEF